MIVRLLDVLNRRGKALAVRLVKWTGKAPYPIHPKHLIEEPWHHWYLEHLRPTDRVLDLGCANGAHTLGAARACRWIIGVDRDETQLEHARDRMIEAHAYNAEFRARDITRSLAFPSASFDAVLCLDVIEHLVPRQAVLREIHRVLVPGGRLLISAPNRATTWRTTLQQAGLFAYSDPDHKIEYTATEFLAELRAGGFRLAGSPTSVVYDTPLAGLIDVLGGVSLTLYARLSRWKRAKAIREPWESTGFRVVARAV